MAWRIVGGLSGWIMSLAPLVIVNVLALVMVIDPSVISIAGGAALIAGIALGGLTAGSLGGKRGAGWGATVAGAIAAALFAGTLIALMYVLRAQHQLPYLLALHPLRAIGASGFVACLLIGVAALVGALGGRRQSRREERMAAAARPAGVPSGRQPSGPSSQPYPRSGPPTRPGQAGQRGPHDSRYPAESHARDRSSRW